MTSDDVHAGRREPDPVSRSRTPVTGAPGMPGAGPDAPELRRRRGRRVLRRRPGPGDRRHRRLRRRGRGNGRHGRAADGREVDLHRELRLVPHARRRRNDRARSGRTSTSAKPPEGARRRPRDERPGRDAVVQGLARRAADPGGRRLRRGRRGQVAQAQLAGLGREIDDDVRDRHVVARADGLDDAALEPVRPAPGMGRDRRSRSGRTSARRRRPRRAGRRRRPRRAPRCPRRRAARASRRGAACAAARAGSSSDVHVLQARVQRGADDEELRPLGQRERADRAQQLLAARPSRSRRRARAARPAPPSARPARGSGAGPRWRRYTRPRRPTARGTSGTRAAARDPRREHDERERADRDQQEPERRRLAPKRALHRALTLRLREGRRSSRRRSTSRRRSASRSRGARRRGGAPARSGRGSRG